MLKRLRVVSLVTLLTILIAFIPLGKSSPIHAASSNLVQDSGFENQTTNTVSSPWSVEGSGSQGIDRGAGFAHSGQNNAWIRTSDKNWHSITQAVSVQQNTSYTLSGWIIDNFGSNLGYFGVRTSDGVTVLQQTSYSALSAYTQLTMSFNSGSNATVTVFTGFWGQGTDYWMRLDDISLFQGSNLVQDSGFENQTTNTVSSPWSVEGSGSQGIDRGAGFAHSGQNNAWIRTSDKNWHSIIQTISVQQNTNYTLNGWIIDNFGSNLGYFGVRTSDGVTVLQQTSYSALPEYTKQIVDFNSGSNSTITIFAGFWGQGTDYWTRLDDISLWPSIFAGQSTFFATAQEESYSTYTMSGNGDLWPSCWADDGNLYTANGDGSAFGSTSTDMAVSRVSGTPPSLSGTTLTTNVGTDWEGSAYNRKPTGMLCVNGTLYLAFQNLQTNYFNSAPVASIAQSTDHGASWTWNTSAPMFTNGLFTTIFFLDYGQNYAHAIDGYVYAYGLDGNWRGQQQVYLARVPNTQVMTRSSWQFYTGTDNNGHPTWSTDITEKVPVLEDDRTLYQQTFGGFCCTNSPVIAQGGVTYDAPLNRYIFSSWSYATQEFYESPTPWGPWKLFLSKDFGPAQLAQNVGQYGTSIPSKFISTDGKTMYVQSNLCCSGSYYTFALRKLAVQPYVSTTPTNGKNATNNLAQTGDGTTAISKSTHFGTLSGANFSDSLNNGNLTESEDDWDQEVKPSSWWGYTWNQTYNMDKVVYTTGKMFSDGGWFSSGLVVQVRQNFTWVTVSGLSASPSYPYSNAAGTNVSYTFTFNPTWGDGVRIIGAPGGTSYFTSIGELAAYYA